MHYTDIFFSVFFRILDKVMHKITHTNQKFRDFFLLKLTFRVLRWVNKIKYEIYFDM